MATTAKNHLLSSDHVNYMVFRYLQEAGFTHSAFTFANESAVTKAPVDPNNVAPGMLIALIQKGMQYLELEANVEQDGEVNGDFKMLTPEELLTHDPEQLRQLVQERREEQQQQKEQREREQQGAQKGGGRGGGVDKRRGPRGREQKADKQDVVDKGVKGKGRAADRERAGHPAGAATPGGGGGATPMDEDTPSASHHAQLEVPASDVTTLHGHESEVYICAWSPTEPLLASGSGDGTSRIWNLAPGPGYATSTVLLHQAKAEAKARDVTTLDWNGDGSLLATGSYDGLARIWSKDGKLKQTLDKHAGPVFALKWNKKGDMLLSGSVDKKVIVWDVKAGEAKQVLDHHQAAALDVDWRNNTSFASCSTDMLIAVCRVGEAAPLKTFSGHKDEVNAIKWDPSGTYLASCSDDTTAKVWSTKGDAGCVQDLREHKKEVYTLRWSPTGAGTANPTLPLLLATASFDTTVKLWDVEQGKCVHTLQGHTESVYSVAFSPNGKYLATGSFDNHIFVWDVADGTLLRTWRGEAGIYDVSWNEAGDKVAACFANNRVCVVALHL